MDSHHKKNGGSIVRDFDLNLSPIEEESTPISYVELLNEAINCTAPQGCHTEPMMRGVGGVEITNSFAMQNNNYENWSFVNEHQGYHGPRINTTATSLTSPTSTNHMLNSNYHHNGSDRLVNATVNGTTVAPTITNNGSGIDWMMWRFNAQSRYNSRRRRRSNNINIPRQQPQINNDPSPASYTNLPPPSLPPTPMVSPPQNYPNYNNNYNRTVVLALPAVASHFKHGKRSRRVNGANIGGHVASVAPPLAPTAATATGSWNNTNSIRQRMMREVGEGSNSICDACGSKYRKTKKAKED